MKNNVYCILRSKYDNVYFLLLFLISFFFTHSLLEGEFPFAVTKAIAEKTLSFTVATVNDNCAKDRNEIMNVYIMGWDGSKHETVDLFKLYENSFDLNTAHPNENNPIDTYWSYLQQLCGIDGGEVQSLAEIQTYASLIKNNGGSFIGYNIEKDKTPIAEVDDPISSMAKACDIARQNGLMCLLAPSKALTTNYLNNILTMAHPDIYIIQGQSLQNNETKYHDFVKPRLDAIELFDSDIITLSQVSTQIPGTTVEKMKAAYDIVDYASDGVTIWYGTPQKNMVKQFVQWFEQKY